MPILQSCTFLPSLARHAHSSAKAFHERARELLISAGVGFPLLTAVTYGVAPIVIQTLYGPGYLAAVPALRILLIGFLIMAFNLVLQQVLIALDKERQSLAGSVLVCLSNLIVSALLIPRFGILGTCYALIISELLYLGAQIYLLRCAYRSLKTEPTPPPTREGGNPLCSIIIPTYNTR